MGNREESLLLSRRQVGDALGGVCTKTIDKLIREGSLPATRVGRKVFVPTAAVIEFAAGEHAERAEILRRYDGDPATAGMFARHVNSVRDRLLNSKKGR